MGRIAIIAENSVEYVEKILSIWECGNCAVLIDWRIPIQRAIEMMNEAEVTLCYVDRELNSDDIALAGEKIKFVVFEATRCISEIPDSIKNKYQPNYSEADALILFSSGTTGASKGIILSYFAINTNADAISEYMITEKKECVYIVKSIAHSSTMVGELLVALKNDLRIIIGPTVVPPRIIFSNIIKYSVTIICVNPALLGLLVDEYRVKLYEICSLKSIYVSGDIISTKQIKIAREVLQGVNLYNVYGLTEAGPRVSAQRKGCSTNASVGKTLRNVEVSIRDNNGSILGEREYGNVYVRTPSLYKGYIVGKAKFSSYNSDELNTGDIGYIDNGELFIVGRADDVINVSAHKVYPKDVEKIILDNLAIEECAVVSEQYRGAVIIACYYVADNDLDTSQLNILNKYLANYEIPKRFYKVNNIAKTIMGKRDYKKLQEDHN